MKKFKWTAADQNTVANLIAGKKMKPDKAAEAWVKANPGKVNAWLRSESRRGPRWKSVPRPPSRHPSPFFLPRFARILKPGTCGSL